MFDDEIRVHVAARVEVPYDLRFMPSVLDWAMQISLLSGANTTENDNLRLALEETLSFLITAYPDAEDWELIRVGFGLLTNGFVELAITNAGPPVHLNRIPTYDPQNPEDRVDGLWYFLAREVVDELEFVNLGQAGWRVVIRKQLAHPSLSALVFDDKGEAAPQVKPKLSIRYAVPEDAEALMDLTFATYRYSYVGETFYHEAKLREALESGELVSTLVECEGKIVGNSSMVIPGEAPRCGYMGSLMVQPEFRRTRAIMHIIKETDRYMAENPLGLDLYYSTIVTVHPASQKAAGKVSNRPVALYLNIGTGENYRGITSSVGHRENFVLYVRLAKKPTVDTLYVPQRHHAVMRPLLELAGCPLNLVAQEVPPEGETQLAVEVYSCLNSAMIKVERMGSDFTERLRKTLFGLRANGTGDVLVLVSATEPLSPNLDEEMALHNGVFTGIKPHSCSEYYNIYSVLFNCVDFEGINLVDPLTQNLKEHILTLYRETVGEILSQ